MRIINDGSLFSRTGGRTPVLGMATCALALALSCSSDDGTSDLENDQTGAGGTAWGAGGSGFPPGSGGSGFPPGSGGSGFPPGSGGAYVPPVTCGNGVRDADEQCEGGDHGGSTCSTATMGAMPEGTVACTAACQLDTTGCFGNLGTGGGAGTGGSGFGGTPGTGGSGLGGGSGAGGSPPTGGPVIPSPTSACPNFVDGTATFTADNRSRQVRLWIDAGAAAAQDGPIVFYWYGTGGNPQQAVSGLGTAGIQRITSAGGIVAAAVHVTSGAGFPWLSGGPEDLALTDEVVACARESVGIDTRRIHALGFSAGALFTGRLSVERSSYIASVATYSGGGGGTLQDPNNKFAAMLLHGGSGDQVVVNFQTATQDFYTFLKDRGHFAIICNHGRGHQISDTSSVVQFLMDHPYGAVPSPYAGGLPGGFPSYCTL